MQNRARRSVLCKMLVLVVVFAELHTWSLVCGADGSWTEILAFENTLHLSDFPNRTTPTRTSCIALGTSTPGCSHVTYLYSTSTCHLHSQLQGRQSVKNSRIWSKKKQCPDNFMLIEQIGACLYLSTVPLYWSMAEIYCETLQARLLVTTTQSKIKAVNDAITESTSFWIGGHVRSSRNGEWITGDSVEFSAFDYNFNNDFAPLDTCLYFQFSGTNEMQLANDDCFTEMRYICEAK